MKEPLRLCRRVSASAKVSGSVPNVAELARVRWATGRRDRTCAPRILPLTARTEARGDLVPYGPSETLEVADEAVDVGAVVLDRDEPLLGLAPGREEDATVVLDQPMGVVVPVVDLEEVAVVMYRLNREGDATLRPDRDDVSRQPCLDDHFSERLVDLSAKSPIFS